MNDIMSSILFGSVGLVIGVIIMVVMSKLGLNKNQQKANLIIKEAEIEAENARRQAVIDGKNQAYELKLAAEKELKERRQEITELENKLMRREDTLNFRDEKLTTKEKNLDDKLEQVKVKTSELEKMESQLQAKIDVQVEELERIANLSVSDAKTELFAIVEKRMANEVTAYIRDREEEAKTKASENARNIIALAIQR